MHQRLYSKMSLTFAQQHSLTLVYSDSLINQVRPQNPVYVSFPEHTHTHTQSLMGLHFYLEVGVHQDLLDQYYDLDNHYLTCFFIFKHFKDFLFEILSAEFSVPSVL